MWILLINKNLKINYEKLVSNFPSKVGRICIFSDKIPHVKWKSSSPDFFGIFPAFIHILYGARESLYWLFPIGSHGFHIYEGQRPG